MGSGTHYRSLTGASTGLGWTAGRRWLDEGLFEEGLVEGGVVSAMLWTREGGRNRNKNFGFEVDVYEISTEKELV